MGLAEEKSFSFQSGRRINTKDHGMTRNISLFSRIKCAAEHACSVLTCAWWRAGFCYRHYLRSRHQVCGSGLVAQSGPRHEVSETEGLFYKVPFFRVFSAGSFCVLWYCWDVSGKYIINLLRVLGGSYSTVVVCLTAGHCQLGHDSDQDSSHSPGCPLFGLT